MTDEELQLIWWTTLTYRKPTTSCYLFVKIWNQLIQMLIFLQITIIIKIRITGMIFFSDVLVKIENLSLLDAKKIYINL